MAVDASGLVVCVCVRAYGTIWWLDTCRGLDSRLGSASSDRQDQQHRAETVKYEPHHGARCQRGTQLESRDQGAGVVFGLPGRCQSVRYELVMCHDHGGPVGRLWAARNGSKTVHLPSVPQVHRGCTTRRVHRPMDECRPMRARDFNDEAPGVRRIVSVISSMPAEFTGVATTLGQPCWRAPSPLRFRREPPATMWGLAKIRPVARSRRPVTPNGAHHLGTSGEQLPMPLNGNLLAERSRSPASPAVSATDEPVQSPTSVVTQRTESQRVAQDNESEDGGGRTPRLSHTYTACH